MTHLAVRVARKRRLLLEALEGRVTPSAAQFWKTYLPSEAFSLHSKPGSSKVLYMDFNGHTASGTPWNTDYNNGNAFTVPAWSMDADRTVFSDAERLKIIAMWRTTAEDYAPFDIDVTTQDPGVAALIRAGGGDTAWGARAVIGPDPKTIVANQPDVWPDAVGLAETNSFGSAIDNPCFVWSGDQDPNPEVGLPDTVSHEVGHMLGLEHDGSTTVEYYPGHGTGAVSWGPIMGDPTDRALTQWSRATYPNANNNQDDLAVITSLANGVVYRADDFGNSIAAATTVSTSNVPTYGIIEKNTDSDFFRFSASAGQATIQVDPLAAGANLDVLIQLLNASGTVLQTNNPGTAINASITYTIPATGNYYIQVVGTGLDPLTTGYPNYGSLGNYRVRVSAVAGPANLTHVSVEPIFGIPSLVFTDVAGNTANNVTFKISASRTAVEISDPNVVLTTNTGTVSNAGHKVTVPLAEFANGRIQINTGGGNDAITLDFANGAIDPTGTGSIFLNAGTGSDSLRIQGAGTGYARFITGLAATASTSASVRFTPVGLPTIQHFLSNL